MTKHARFSLLPSFIIFSAALLAGCNDQGDTQAHAGEPQVTVHVVETAPLAVTTELP
ncbi:efflux transporter periplasmic adaptor subunit, partial [Salmonella enterica subsp. enterica serovar Javiana]|nr:efflux transporter periplasmic adaptor subunit [Salmonella enterica subsp. enterica serovar Javiana]